MRLAFLPFSAIYVSTELLISSFILSIFFFFPVHDLPYIPQHKTRGVLIYVLVMSCLIAFFFTFLFSFFGIGV